MNQEILAIDLATTTGWARGRVGEDAPMFGTASFAGKDQNQVFAKALQWMMEMVRESPPQIVIIESMLPPQAMLNKTSRQVRDRLAGLHGVIRGCARRWGVGEISECSVGDVRKHFTGFRNMQRASAKQSVMEQCKALGWNVTDDNQGDACAIWSYAVSLIDPKQALRVSPLFNKGLRVTGW